MTILEIESVSKRFRKVQALEGVSVTLGERTLTTLVGRNGAGKTTLLNSIADLLAPDAGHITVLGRTVKEHGKSVFRKMALASDVIELPANLTALETFDFHAAINPGWSHSRARELSRRFQMDERVRIRFMSKGTVMQLRVILALASHPRLCLLDEPFSGLDPVARETLTGAMLEQLEADGTCFLVSTHDVDEIAHATDRVIVLVSGKVRFDCTPDWVADRVRAITVDLGTDGLEADIGASRFVLLGRVGRLVELAAIGWDSGLGADEVRKLWPSASITGERPVSIKEFLTIALR